MRRAPQLALVLILAGSLAHAGCDGTGGTVITSDSGPSDSGPPPTDAPDVDRQRPQVIGSDPAQGATGVAGDVAIVVELSEPMLTEAGTVLVEVDGAEVATDATWSATGTELTITPSAPFASEARVRVVLEDDFSDLAGNTLALPYVLAFDVGDLDPPVVVSSDPAQGATGLSARLAGITVTFDELMDSSAGTFRLEGGVGTLGTPTWIDGRTVRVPASGLAYETAYRVLLEGFVDASGNALDLTVYLSEGAIELETSTDVDAPQISDSVPGENQVNVPLRGTPSVVFVFDEPMDTSVGTATLRATTAEITTVLAPTWSAGGTRLTLAVAGRLYPDAPHSVELVGFRDLAGNALDLVTHLGDGRLDFDTGADSTLPIVVFSYPQEGSVESDHTLDSIRVVFDRAMSTAPVTTLRVDDGLAPFDAPVTWNMAGTQATLDVSGRIHAGRTHHVDLRTVVDLAGDPVDHEAPYLGDGILDFTTRAPRGEQCRDELTVAQATAMLPSGGFEWSLAATSMTTIDNGSPCRYPGAPATSPSPDAVIVYRKTTTAGSAGGRYLHVSVEAPLVGDRATLAVYRDACGEAAAAGPAARLTCQWDRHRWEQYLDIGAGDYYVWAGLSDSSVFRGLVVRIEEVDAVPSGESCASPYTTASPLYTAPTTPDGEHVWTIPSDSYHAADMDDAWPGEGAAICDEDGVQGTDFVIQFDKARADSLVSLVIDPGADVSSLYQLNLEARSTCAAAGTGGRLACAADVWDGTAGSAGARLLTFPAPAGPVYFWVSNNEQDSSSGSAIVRVQEIDPAPGTSCANAIPLPASGSTAITPTSPARFRQPSCFDGGAWQEGITWYRVTSTSGATQVRADVAGGSTTIGAVAVFDATSDRELSCATDAATVPLVAVGSDVCIAVRNGSGVARLDTTQVTYTGVGGAPTQLNIQRPFDGPSSSDEETITTERWMAVSPTTLYMALSSGVMFAPLGGNTRADYFTDFTIIGNGGVAVGEALWSLDDLASAGMTARLYRLSDGTGTWGPTAWDAMMAWPADGFDAITYDGASLLVANDYASTTLPVQLRSFDPGMAGASTMPVTIDPALRNVVAIAADATWLYLAGSTGSGTTLREGVYRIRRVDVGTATAAELIALVDLSITRAPMVIDSTTAATHLYVRDDGGDIHVVVDPSGTPVHLGVISTLGTNSDEAMAYSAATDSLYVFESESNSDGNFVRLD